MEMVKLSPQRSVLQILLLNLLHHLFPYISDGFTQFLVSETKVPPVFPFIIASFIKHNLQMMKLLMCFASLHSLAQKLCFLSLLNLNDF